MVIGRREARQRRSSSQPQSWRRENVATIGYPAYDSRIPEPDLMERIYGKVYNKKRLAPGGVTQRRRRRALAQLHDAGRQFRFRGVRPRQRASARAAFQRQLPGHELRGARRCREEAAGRRPRRPRDPTDRERIRALRARSSSAVPPSIAQSSGGSGASLTIPITVTSRSASIPRAWPRRRDIGCQPLRAGDEPPEFIAETEAVAADYRDRGGYDPAFLGERVGGRSAVGRPECRRRARFRIRRQVGDRATIRTLFRRYEPQPPHVLLERVNIDGNLSQKSARVGWKWDPRIPKAQQIMNECYGNPPKFSRGHMTRREDPGWGNAEDGQARQRRLDARHQHHAADAGV